MSEHSTFFGQFGSGGSSGGGGSSNTLYNANDTIGSSREATLTDTLVFKQSGGTNNLFTLNTSGIITIQNGGNTYSKWFANGDVALGGDTIIGVQAGICLHRNTLTKAEADTLGNIAFQTVNTSNLGIFQVRGNGNIILGNNSFVGSENISLQGSTFIKGTGTSTGVTLALYDDDTTPYKRLEILDNGQFHLDSSNAVVNTPVLIEMRPFAGTGLTPYFKIKAYGEIEALGRLSTLFRLKNGSGNDIFEVQNGAFFLNGTTTTTSSFFEMKTTTTALELRDHVGNLHHKLDTSGGGLAIKAIFNATSGEFIVGSTAVLGSEDISLQGNTLIDGTLDMNNNRILKTIVNPSVQETTSTATLTIDADQENEGILTAMAVNLAIASPTGTPVQGQSLIFRFKDDGSARTLTWNAIFRAIGVTIPTTTTASKVLYVGCKYNSTDTKWDVVSVQEEA